MRTRIRELRKSRNRTLQQLAEQVGTTAQTIQRLETGNMTVSLDWLEKIAAAFGIAVSGLLPSEPGREIELVGTLGADFRVLPRVGTDPERSLTLVMPGQTSLAVRLTSRIGPHEEGTVLIAGKLDTDEASAADGRDCLVGIRDGDTLFRRVVLEGDRPMLFIPYDARPGVQTDLDIDWLAPISMAVRYF